MNITTVPMLSDLQGPWAGFSVRLLGPGASTAAEPTPMRDVYPFLSLTDFKRLLWVQQSGDPRWSPERVFLCVRGPTGGLRPLEFHWQMDSVDLPDPMIPENHVPSPLLVDAAGNRLPVAPTMIGGLLLEVALSP